MDKPETTIKNILAHINSIIETYHSALDDKGNISEQDAIRIITRSRSLIHKISERDSPYSNEIDKVYEEGWHTGYKVEMIVGILLGIRDELLSGGLSSVYELIRGDLFDDFLEMAEYLNSEGYKDAAAVIAGSSLEAHLRQIAHKHNIATNNSIHHKYKSAEGINQELYNAQVYSSFEMKQITTWLDLRNNAAHGNYSKYSSTQVMQLIVWTKEFIRNLRA